MELGKKQATDSANIADIQESIKYQVLSIKDELNRLASDSATLNTKYSLLDTKLTPPDILYATGSASLLPTTNYQLLTTSEATISGMLKTYD